MSDSWLIHRDVENRQNFLFLNNSFLKFFQICLYCIVVFLLLGGIIGISSCSQGFIKSIQGTIQKTSESVEQTWLFLQVLREKFPEDNISLEVSNHYTHNGWNKTVNIEFLNSSLNKLTASERQVIAKKITQLAKEHLELNNLEDSVSVDFIQGRDLGILEYGKVIDSYTMKP